MCGIAAIFKLNKIFDSTNQIVKMTEIIRHRGPDDEGYVLFPANGSAPIVCGGKDTPEDSFSAETPYAPKYQSTKVSSEPLIGAMGHRRLSIVDLSSGGHQPMCSEDEAIWITYNGEIYNFIEVRQELESKGYQFKTSSDTEVIIHAYRHWGKECLGHFNGMFSFVLFDGRENKVFAARDRFGIKPLYYWITPNGLVAFASEIKQFTVLNGWKSVWNPQRVYDYLIWGVTDHTKETLFCGVHQIRGGEYLELSLNSEFQQSINPKVWYRLKGKDFQGGFEDASEEYLQLFRDSISLRLRADVEVGSCLSGGLDSSSIVCLVNELLDGDRSKQSTFSACSHIKRFDEKPFIDDVVNKTGVIAHYTYPSLETLFEDTREIIWHQDEPYGSTSIFAQWQVFKKVREQKIKVMLDGQGADEQLGGYLGFFGNRFYDLFTSFQWIRLVKEMRLTKNFHKHLSPSLMLMKKIITGQLRQSINNCFRKSVIKPEWLDISRLGATPRDPFENIKSQKFYDQSELEISLQRIPRLLHYEDRDSMAHSVESRIPFMDYRLVEFTMGLPSEFKLSEGWTKRVLRESMRNRLPESVRLRIDKLGFITPEEVWLTKHQPESFRKAIMRSIDNSNGIINHKIMKEVNDIINGKRLFSSLPWRIVCFGYWIERFDVAYSN